jgi:hypothetical protein
MDEKRHVMVHVLEAVSLYRKGMDNDGTQIKTDKGDPSILSRD